MMVEFPGVGQNFLKLKETPPLNLQKINKKFETVQFFCLENLEKPFIFYTEAKPLETL